MSFAYRLPDGSADHPDPDGNHTATVNVLHSAEQAKRFPGCASCKLVAQLDIHNQHVVMSYEDWDGEDFGRTEKTVTFTPGCAVCERNKAKERR